MEQFGANLDYLSKFAKLYGHYVEVKKVRIAGTVLRHLTVSRHLLIWGLGTVRSLR